MTVPKSHPRFLSLRTRDKLVEGWENGLVATQGLIAHGRGEAFDYLIGEQTTPEALEAEKIAAATLLNASHPVISVNGNVGALVSNELAELSRILECPCEVNIFHRTEERVDKLVDTLKGSGCYSVLGDEPDSIIPGLDHARAHCTREGIFTADVVLVPLEDGDRCKALKDMGKKVITIDLNPLSRTARTADVTIVDNLMRAVPKLIELCSEGKEKGTICSKNLSETGLDIDGFNNISNMDRTLEKVAGRFCQNSR